MQVVTQGWEKKRRRGGQRDRERERQRERGAERERERERERESIKCILHGCKLWSLQSHSNL